MDHHKIHRQNHPSSGDVDSMRSRRRHEQIDLRKEQRDKILLAKRVRLQSLEVTSEDEDITELQIQEFTISLQKASSDRKKILEILRKSFAKGTLFIDAFLSVPNAMECLVGILSGQDSDLQLEAAWCLTNISAGMHEHALVVLKMAAPYLITYLTSNNQVMQDQCAWALGNIAGDSSECRDVLKDQGIIPPLVELLKSSSPAVIKSASFAISNMARAHDPSIREMLSLGLPRLVLNLMIYKKEMIPVISEVAWILTYLTASGEYEEELKSYGVIPAISTVLTQLVRDDPDNIQTVTPLLRALGNICSGADRNSVEASQTDGLLVALCTFLQSEHRHIKKECLWAVSNMTGEMNVAREIVAVGAVPHFINLTQTTYDIRKEAAYCICNLVCHGNEFCKVLLKAKGIQAMIPFLKASSNDVEVIHLGLCFFESMFRAAEVAKRVFEENGGVGYLESLEYHANDNIRFQANNLLDTYFYIDEEQDVDDDTLDDLSTLRQSTQLGDAG